MLINPSLSLFPTGKLNQTNLITLEDHEFAIINSLQPVDTTPTNTEEANNDNNIKMYCFKLDRRHHERLAIAWD